ncbi:hypothetical protein BDQ17DRAFT_1367017 [Cyathus striatus]|nr:hypothetical protein BDQ17DRAFT_1367017 [Cyathus striatus]
MSSPLLAYASCCIQHLLLSLTVSSLVSVRYGLLQSSSGLYAAVPKKHPHQRRCKLDSYGMILINLPRPEHDTEM